MRQGKMLLLLQFTAMTYGKQVKAFVNQSLIYVCEKIINRFISLIQGCVFVYK